MNLKSILFSFLCRYPSLFSRVQLSRSKPDVTQLAFLSLVARGQTVFDVGANFGSYTRLFSKLVGRRAGGVYAFEPVAASMKRLQQAVQGINNVTLVKKGLGLVPQKATIFIPNGDLGQSSLAKHHVGSWSGDASCAEETIEMTTLDLFVEENGIQRLDFLKVDVEGGEASVLKGGEKTIRQFLPTLYLELNSHWLKDYDESPVTVSNRLAQWGYSNIYVPQVAGRRFGFRGATPREMDNRDFLFSPNPLQRKLLND